MRKNIIIFGLVLILLSSIAYGWSDYLLIDDLTTSAGTGNSFGVEISTNTTGDFLFNITKESGDESIRCALYETDGTLIINKTFDDDICSFVTNVTADEKYFMMGMRDSSSTLKYKSPGGTPYTSAYGYFTYHDQIRYNGEIWEISPALGTIRNLNLTYLEESEPYFELTAKNVYDDSSISNFTAQITNSTTAVNISTTNGTIVWGQNDTINISIINANETGNLFFNQSYTEISTDSNFEAELVQAYANFILTNLDNSTMYDDVNWTMTHLGLNISKNIFGTSTMTTFNATSGDYNYSVQKTGYPSSDGTFSLNALDNTTIYVAIGFFAEINLLDEATTEPFNISRTNSTRVTVVCENIGSYEHDLDNFTSNISINCVYTKLRFVVTYDDTTYTRNILSSQTDIFSRNVYLIDLTTTQSLYNAFIVNDYTGEYDDPSLYVKKNMEGDQVIIHSDNLDIENKMSVYLIENDEYIIELHSDNNPTEVLGFYGADISGTKEITVTTSNIDISEVEFPGTGVFTYSYAKNVSDDLYAYAFYSDIETLTTEVTWSLWFLNETNDNLTQIYEVTSLGNYGNLTFTPQNITEYVNYTVFSSISYEKDGDVSVYYLQINAKREDKRDGTAFGYYTISDIQWGVVILLSVIALSGTITTQNFVNYIIVGAAAVALIFGLMNIFIVILVLSLFVTFIYNLKTADETKIAR